MKDQVIDSIGRMDEDLIEEVDALRQKNHQNRIRRPWRMLAACLCMVVAAAIVAVPHFRKNIAPAAEDPPAVAASHFQKNTAPTAEDFPAVADEAYAEEAYGIVISGQEGLVYYPISFEERVRFQLLPDDSVGLTPENTYRITEKDLGAVMGTITDPLNTALTGKTVYHFAAFPESKAICILDNGGNYAFYCTEGYDLDAADSESSTAVMETYDLPNSCTEIYVKNADGQTLFLIQDADTITKVCQLLTGCENIGREAVERKFAQLWYDAYGNDDFFYSESDGQCLYHGEMPQPEQRTYTDEAGNVITETVYPENYVDPYDQAAALWTKGERCLELQTKEGFRLFVDYFPTICAFISQNGRFALSDEAAFQLNAILKSE